MKKLLISVLLCGALALCACADFSPTREYENGKFTDISESAWYYKEVINTYKTGLVNGMSENTFNPDGSVTVAQAITIASRINSIYNDNGEAFQQGETWYSVYVNYAIENGIINENMFDDYNRNIKRSEMASLIAASLPDKEFSKLNDVISIPDVSESSDAFTAVLKLYNAGIIMGNDDYGTFYPNNDIKRSELAAIVNRVTTPTNRIKKDLLTMEIKKAAPIYLCDGNNSPSASAYAQLGWNFDNRGGISGVTNFTLNDISSKERCALVRPIAEQTSGTVTVECAFSLLTDSCNGYNVYLGDGEENAAFMLFVKDNKFFATNNNSDFDLNIQAARGAYYLKAVYDIDKSSYTVMLNNVKSPVLAANAISKINTFMYASTNEGVASVAPKYTKIHTGYALNDAFISTQTDVLPSDWSFTGENAVAAVAANNSSRYDDNGLDITAAKGSKSTLSQSYAPIGGKVAFEMKYYVNSLDGKVTVSLTSKNNEVFSIISDGKMFYDKNGNSLKAFKNDLWQTLRIEANTLTKKAVFKINYKTVGEYDFDESSFDGVKVTFETNKDCLLRLDDFLVFNMFDEEADYVPVPKPIESKDYAVGSLVCDIWRNGYHFGWDYVAPFEEMTPYTGFFDEGSPEVADWDTKWMTEHGIDFRLVCWYSGIIDTPLKTPRNSFGLNDGYLNSKYSNMHKFAIMWENASNNPTSRESFRSTILAYWIEYYLTDDRYFTIDNKPVIAIYNTPNLLTLFENEAGVKQELDYIRSVCKQLGYDGAIILTTGGSSDVTRLEQQKAMGFDGIFAYNWGTEAFNPSVQINAVSAQNDKNILTTVPTVAVGFNSIPLYGIRYKNISVPDYEKMLGWVKNDFLSKREQGSWESKLLILSNWNEYGEGHYICPSALNGFGYLDAIRKVFTENSAHEDVKPTENQKKRFCNLFPQDRKLIRRLMWEKNELNADDLYSVLAWDFMTEEARAKWTPQFNVTDYTNNATSISGKSVANDFAIKCKDVLSYPTDTGAYFHVRMKNTLLSGDESTRLQVFFITDVDTTYDDNKCVYGSITADGEYHDYFVDMSSSKGWKSTITGLRFDPMMTAGSFEIELIEFMNENSKLEVNINKKAQSFDFDPILNENNQLLIPFYPYSGISQNLNSYYTWNFSLKQLTINANTHRVVFTVGKDTAVVDGVEKPCGTTVTLRDGLPIIPLNFLCEALGYVLEINGNIYDVYTAEAEIADVIKNKRDYEWEFNIDDEIEGWSYACAALSGITNGAARFTSTSNGKRHDPALTSPDFAIPAKDYDKITVGLNYTLAEVDKATAVIFFTTSSDSKFDEKKTVRANLPTKSSNGEFIELVFDMKSNELWDATATKIRFDPFDAVGSFDVDYIRIVKNN